MPHVYCNHTFHLKNKPKGHTGLTKENWNTGKNIPLSPSEFIVAFSKSYLEFYVNTMHPETESINEEIKKAAKRLDDIYFQKDKE